MKTKTPRSRLFAATILIAITLAGCNFKGCAPDPNCIDCPPNPVQTPPKLLGPISMSIACFSDSLLYPKSTAIQFDETALLNGNKTIGAQFFDSTVVLVLDTTEEQMLMQTWQGHIQGETESYFLFVKSGEIFSGIVGYDAKTYSIKYCHGLYGMALVDASQLPMSDSLDTSPTQTITEDYQECTEQALLDNCQIDLMVLYTKQARHSAGLEAGVLDVNDTLGQQIAIQSEIYEAVSLANFAFSMGKLPIRVHVTYVQMIDRTNWETNGSLATTKNRLDSDQEVLELRNAYAADLVCLIVENGKERGISTMFSKPISSARGYAVVRRDCASKHYSLAHELGHLLGLRHDCSADMSAGDGHGYCFLNHKKQRYQTIMAIQPDYKRLPFYSDAKRPWGSYRPMPHNNCVANDVAVLRDTAKIISNYRCAGYVDDVWINDNFADKGEEPNASLTAQSNLISPNMWVRNDQDRTLIHLYQHQNAPLHQKSYLYVKLRNGSQSPQKGVLKTYFKAPTLTWKPNPHDSMTSSNDSIILLPNSARVIEIPFQNNLDPHLAYAVEWSARNDTLTNPNCSTLFECITTNNNMAAKCLAIVYLSSLKVGGRSSSKYQTSQAIQGHASETLATSFQPIDGSFINIRFERNENNQRFVDVGGIVYSQFEVAGIRTKLNELPFDTLSLPKHERPSAYRQIIKNVEIPIPIWYDPAPELPTRKFYLTVDAGNIQIPGTYRIHIQQILILLGETSVFGSYTYEIVVSP